jgi:hypothetical protein
MITKDAAYEESMQSQPGADAQDKALKLTGKSYSKTKALNNYESYIRYEVILYCLKKESMLINVDKIIQSISTLYKDNEAFKKHPVREFYYSCDEGLLLLPQHTAPQFVSETYKAGVLCFYLPGK